MRVSLVSTINNLLTVGYVFPAFETAVVSPHLGKQSQELEILGIADPFPNTSFFVADSFSQLQSCRSNYWKNQPSLYNVPLPILYQNNDFQWFKLLLMPQIKNFLIPMYFVWAQHSAIWVVTFLAGTSQCLHLCLAPHENNFAYKQPDMIGELMNDGSWTIFILPRGPVNALGRLLLRFLLLVICFPWTAYSW